MNIQLGCTILIKNSQPLGKNSENLKRIKFFDSLQIAHIFVLYVMIVTDT